MKDFRSFLETVSKDSKRSEIWDNFHDFCNNFTEVETAILVKHTADLMDWVNAHGMYNSLFKGIDEGCEKDLSKIKAYCEGLTVSEEPRNYGILDRLLATLFNYDNDWAIEQINKLLDAKEPEKLSKGITAIGYCNLENDELKTFITQVEKIFQDLVKPDLANELKANLLFAYRAQRKHFSSADDYIKVSLNVDDDEIKAQLCQALYYNINIDDDPDLYQEVLLSLVSINHKLFGAHNHLAYKLGQALEKHYDIIIDFLNAWVSYSPENAGQVVLFQSVFNELYDKNPSKFSQLATQWINEDKINFHIAIFKVFQQVGYIGVYYVQLDKKLLKSYSINDVEFIVKKIIGFEYDKDRLNSMLYSILENTYENQDALNLVAGYYVDYLIFNYYSSIDFLEEKRTKASEKLKKIIDEIIEEGKKLYEAYSELKILKEFEPSEERLNYMGKIQAKKFRKDHEEHRKNDTGFLSMVSTIHFRSGKTSFAKFKGEYSEHMEPKLISHSAEMPRGEYIDPVNQKLMRLDGRIFIRRK